jgi:hypothetical protein
MDRTLEFYPLNMVTQQLHFVHLAHGSRAIDGVQCGHEEANRSVAGRLEMTGSDRSLKH